MAKHNRFELNKKNSSSQRQHLVKQMLDCLEEARAASGLAWSQMESLVLAGGPFQNPWLQEPVANATGLVPRMKIDPTSVVSFGAALHGYHLAKKPSPPSVDGDSKKKFAGNCLLSGGSCLNHPLATTSASQLSTRNRQAVRVSVLSWLRREQKCHANRQNAFDWSVPTRATWLSRSFKAVTGLLHPSVCSLALCTARPAGRGTTESAYRNHIRVRQEHTGQGHCARHNQRHF